MKDEEKGLIAGVACFFIVLAILVVSYEVRERIDNTPAETLVEEYSEVDTFDYFQAEIDKAEAARKAATQNNEKELNVGDISDEEIEDVFGSFIAERQSEINSREAARREEDTEQEQSEVFSLEEESEIETYYFEEESSVEETEEQEVTADITETTEVEEETQVASEPVVEPISSIIIDTDFASDADDILAIRLALCYQDMGIINVQGISLSTTYSRSPLAIHALCKYDGHGSIPVAMDTSGNGVQVHTNYVDQMYEWSKDRDDYEQPVQMYRRLLASSPTKVNIITLGFLQNIQNLINSQPDAYSPLTGAELMAQKVNKLYIVGGSDDGRPSFNFYWTGEKVINAARFVTNNSPVPIVYLSSDLTGDTFCGQFYQNEDKKNEDIVTKALKSNNQAGGVVAWDVFAMWCVMQDMMNSLEQYEVTKEYGNWYVSQTGVTEWNANPLSPHCRCVKTKYGGEYNAYLNGILHQKFTATMNK